MGDGHHSAEPSDRCLPMFAVRPNFFFSRILFDEKLHHSLRPSCWRPLPSQYQQSVYILCYIISLSPNIGLYFCYTEYRFIKYGSWHAEQVVVLCRTVSNLISSFLCTPPQSANPFLSFVCLKKKKEERVRWGWLKIGHFRTCPPPLEHHHASTTHATWMVSGDRRANW